MADDTEAFRAAHLEAVRIGGVLELKSKTYVIKGWSEIVSAPVKWIGTGATKVIVKRQSIDFKSPSMVFKLQKSLHIGARALNVAKTAIMPGSIIYLEQSVVADLKRAEHLIGQCFLAVDGGSSYTSLDEPCRFLFDKDEGAQATVFQAGAKVSIEGINFLCDDGNAHNRSLTLSGLRDQECVRHCSFSSYRKLDVNDGVDGLMIQQSINVQCSMINVSNCRYGVMVSRGSRAIFVHGVQAYANRHAVYPAYCVSKCLFSNISGKRNHGTIDCHSSFDIAYRNIFCSDELELSNGRASGFSLFGASFAVSAEASLKRMIVSPQAWASGFEHLSRSSVSISHVHLDYKGAPPSDGICLMIGGTGPIDIEDFVCATGDLKVAIANLAARSVKIKASNVHVVPF